jgi:hypothetical protein
MRTLRRIRRTAAFGQLSSPSTSVSLAPLRVPVSRFRGQRSDDARITYTDYDGLKADLKIHRLRDAETD